MGYVKVADRFCVFRESRKEEYVGGVAVSEHGFFFFLSSTSSGAMLALLMNLFGATGLGGWLARWAERRSTLLRPRRTVPLENLPAEITGDPEWPFPLEGGLVAVIPRAPTVEIEFSRLTGLKVRTPDQEFHVAMSFGGHRAKLARLEEMGWPVEHRRAKLF